MNILIKLTCLVGLVIAPILGEVYNNVGHAQVEEVKTEILTTIEEGEEVITTTVTTTEETVVEPASEVTEEEVVTETETVKE